jgi:hypothetical protein
MAQIRRQVVSHETAPDAETTIRNISAYCPRTTPVRRPRRTADRTCPSRLRWCAQLVVGPSGAIAGLDWPPAGTYVFRHHAAASVETISIFMHNLPGSSPSPTDVLLGKADY